MREILFRGFTPYENGKEKVLVKNKWITGKWVVGSYMTLDKTTYCVKEDYEKCPDNTEHYIVFDEMTDWGLPNRHLRADVIPETVGQYTGLTDNNGTKIFEGDIVEYRGTKHKVVFENRFGTSYFGIVISFDETWSFCSMVPADLMNVIGNIHDNPELINEG